MRLAATLAILTLGSVLSRSALALPATPQGGPGCGGQQSEQEPNDTAAAATPIVQSSSQLFVGIHGTIEAGDVDWYSFTAPAGGRAWLSVDTGVAGAGGSRDSVVSLFAPDGSTLIETDDDDGTGNGRDFTIDSLDASLIAGRVLVAGGTYFLRVEAKVPGQTIDGYSLLLVVTTTVPAPEPEPNDCPPGGPGTIGLGGGVVSGSLSSAADSDCYEINVLDVGIPFMVVDGDPERDGIGTDAALRFVVTGGALAIDADSSGSGNVSNPPGEGFALFTNMGTVRITGSGPGTYTLMVSFSGDTCGVPVGLRSFGIE